MLEAELSQPGPGGGLQPLVQIRIKRDRRRLDECARVELAQLLAEVLLGVLPGAPDRVVVVVALSRVAVVGQVYPDEPRLLAALPDVPSHVPVAPPLSRS